MNVLKNENPIYVFFVYTAHIEFVCVYIGIRAHTCVHQYTYIPHTHRRALSHDLKKKF